MILKLNNDTVTKQARIVTVSKHLSLPRLPARLQAPRAGFANSPFARLVRRGETRVDQKGQTTTEDCPARLCS